jgi:DNA/RNA-binding domain of Phe-tRNA-synthetase-like protein
MRGDGTIFQMSEACADLGLLAGIIVLREVAIGESPAELRGLIASAARRARGRFADAAAIRAAPEVLSFRRMYQAVGVNPNRHAPACERLLEMAWRRGNLPSINALVDIYNMVSVECGLSLGAHDLGAITLPIHLDMASRDESFVPLGSYGGGAVRRGEFAYFDGQRRIICRLDLVQAEFSKVTARSSDVVVIVEGTRAHRPEIFEQACSALTTLIAKYCGGRAEIAAWPF